MKASEEAEAATGCLSLPVYFIQTLVVGFIVWLNTSNIWAAIGIVIILDLMVSSSMLAWIAILALTISWGYVGSMIFNETGAIIFAIIGFMLNSSVSKFSRVLSGEFDDESEMKQCPFCAENIKKKAAVCRFCKSSL